MSDSQTHRPLIEASTEIAAPPERVWAVIADPRAMGGFSDQVIRTVVRGTAPVGEGTRTVNLNRRGLVVWPTRAKVVRFDPPREYTYRVKENGALWTFVLEPTATGTRLTHRREAPDGLTDISLTLQDKVLGGVSTFEDEMAAGMERTLQQVRQAAEAG
ncbi:SRPBCC family protein [Janibacter alkaliphilus]|uniref:Uncharacterized protein YndB with AHSA1/START domain n=1 Tax=Janibacter alkaliphilus TaxID=1069963 RepID=A0A852X4N5_9MICO|nr:SRPBCC family protein [Janibacter alkaliphilus]NYG36310.1 uncharacterized protein YndB with AHSA1/START domain [Janibacter alkaliphilus]